MTIRFSGVEDNTVVLIFLHYCTENEKSNLNVLCDASETLHLVMAFEILYSYFYTLILDLSRLKIKYLQFLW